MNTISTTASTNTILAIDLGKYKCVACMRDQDTGEFHFTTFDASRADLKIRKRELEKGSGVV